ncbi:hypothetical protein ERO13_D01G137600v2 [Gossypium hirsutum]|nr:hypothetical protein ERO13_D01G137600v2 [Gossypium hirsutum]TYG83538.1 hypothetical protein ES288_D01G176200v1 [Gossypium darwinii]TYG83545.1 hypothetical protein ES288_D01G176600v1 [Gossypium darwinii]
MLGRARLLRLLWSWQYLLLIVTKWMLNKGQGATMGTYDTLLLAFDMDNRVDEARSLWNMVLHTHNCSISKWLFSRMISLFDYHSIPYKIIEVCQSPSRMPCKTNSDYLLDTTIMFVSIYIK